MKIENNKNNVIISSSFVNSEPFYNKDTGHIWNKNVASTVNDNDINFSIDGISATVTLKDSCISSELDNFTKNNIIIKPHDGSEFSLNLYIEKNIAPDKLQQFINNFSDIISNLPARVLQDLQQECDNILIYDVIAINAKTIHESLLGTPTGHASYRNNQIELSACNLYNKPKILRDVLIHEIGHLLDYYHVGELTDNCSQSNEQLFRTVKQYADNILNIDTENFYSFRDTDEFFADYYLYKNSPASNDEEVQFFNNMNNFIRDYENMESSDFIAKYKIKNPADLEKFTDDYKKLLYNFDYFLNLMSNYNSRKYSSVSASDTIKKIKEHNNL